MSGAAADLRTRQQAGQPRWYATSTITKENALAELLRYRDLYPDVPPEVPAFGLLRLVDSWEEVTAIQEAVATILKVADVS